ncbi:hypothetical protein H8B15_19710 [Hymenobacter sp. BT507]|uniref:Uncharacterized protein n=1 Tax=Hymenobacter citatus TaxID=2763506 RepID=A0ABR7MQB4_9BACT|nr:hypothetical protein [Hymenobacter citatus]MBC6613158.1 hypothetical protein [Hymenobacter citatus]
MCEWSDVEQHRLQQLARVVMQLLHLRLLLPYADGQPAPQWVELSEQLVEVEQQLASPLWPAGRNSPPLYLPWEQRPITPDTDAFIASLAHYVERLVPTHKL